MKQIFLFIFLLIFTGCSHAPVLPKAEDKKVYPICELKLNKKYLELLFEPEMKDLKNYLFSRDCATSKYIHYRGFINDKDHNYITLAYRHKQILEQIGYDIIFIGIHTRYINNDVMLELDIKAIQREE